MNPNIYDAKTQLSKLIERAQAGEDVVIARAGTPAVRVARVELTAHAGIEGIRLVSGDDTLRKLGVPVLWRDED